jgi:hypothetical protein
VVAACIPATPVARRWPFASRGGCSQPQRPDEGHPVSVAGDCDGAHRPVGEPSDDLGELTRLGAPVTLEVADAEAPNPRDGHPRVGPQGMRAPSQAKSTRWERLADEDQRAGQHEPIHDEGNTRPDHAALDNRPLFIENLFRFYARRGVGLWNWPCGHQPRPPESKDSPSASNAPRRQTRRRTGFLRGQSFA